MTLLGDGGGPTNFGDELSPIIVAELSGHSWKWAPLPAADLVAVGSVLNGAARRHTMPIVFGSGLRGADGVVAVNDATPFLLVRGTRTRDALGLADSVPLGDPALIAREIFPLRARGQGRGAHGPLFIPHFAMLRGSAGRGVVTELRKAGWTIILPNRKPADVAGAVARASAVLTTSLHAMVLAHSYGVPVALMTWQASIVEPDFKYEDYISALNAPLIRVDLQSALAQGADAVITATERATEIVAANLDRVIETIYVQGSALV